jgi:Na+-driven multidrug efflux pump
VELGVRNSKKFSLGWGLFIFILLAVLARPIASMFNKNPAVISAIVKYLRIVPLGYGFYGILVLAASVLNVLKKPFHAAFLSVVQMFLLCIPMACAGSRFFGLPGIFTAIAVSYFVSGIMAHVVQLTILAREKKYPV